MLDDYRAWLRSELELLGNASHHAYSFGQANMAKRAIERLDAEIGPGRLALVLDRERVAGILTDLEMLAERSALSPELGALRDRLSAALAVPPIPADPPVAAPDAP